MSVNFIDRQQHERSSLEEYQRKVRFKQVKFCIFLVSIQLALLCLFVRFCVYSLRANASVAENGIAAEFGGGAGRMDQGHIQMVITFLVGVLVYLWETSYLLWCFVFWCKRWLMHLTDPQSR